MGREAQRQSLLGAWGVTRGWTRVIGVVQVVVDARQESMQRGDGVILMNGGGDADEVLSVGRWRRRVRGDGRGVEENEAVVSRRQRRRRICVGELLLLLLLLLNVSCRVHKYEGLKPIWGLKLSRVPMKVRCHPVTLLF